LRHRSALRLVVVFVGLTFAGSAYAHAEVSPAVAVSGAGQVFTLAVPTEKEGATTTTIELTPPSGFAIDSFFPAAGWQRHVQQVGSGEEAEIQKVTWTGGSVPTEEDAVFSFLGSSSKTGTLTFSVRQTYSDGTIVEWTGPESSDTPAPTVKVVSSIGGGGSSTLAIVAIVLGGLALVVALGALLARSGRQVA
jgi:uncharacterized protein YcnI